MKSILGTCAAHRALLSGVRFSIVRVLATAMSLILSGLGVATAQSPSAVPLPERHVTGRVLVQPRPGLSLAELDNIVKPHGGRRAQVIKQINVHVINLPPQANAIAIADALRKNRHLKFAEVDGVLAPDLYPNDPKYPSAWHLPKIGAQTAWDYAQGTGVTIAILDSGVDTTHPDLQSQLVPGWNFYDDNNNVTDVFGHGTGVAGIAAGAGNNGVGITSVSFRSRIMPMRVTDTAGNGFTSLMATALTTAADNGARVANISFLGVSYSSTIDSAAQYMRSKGGVVVISAGNTGALRTDPPRASLTAVAASDALDAHASYSSWGDYVDIAAPGMSIWTTKLGGDYGAMSGTSAASPVVAGVYALMMSAKPGLAPATYDSILFSTAQDLGTTGWDQYFGNGRVNSAAAVNKLLQSTSTDSVPPTASITSPASGSATGLVPVDVAASDNIGVARVELYANNALVATDTSAPYGFTVDSSKYGSSLALQARAYDAAGNSNSSGTVSLAISTDKVAPLVVIVSPSSGSTVSGTVTVSVSASDDQKLAKVFLFIDGKQVATSTSSLKYSWSVPRLRGKQSPYSTLTGRAEDASGNAASATVSVTRR